MFWYLRLSVAEKSYAIFVISTTNILPQNSSMLLALSQSAVLN